MASNNSTTPETTIHNYISNCLYITEGTIMVFGNLLIIVALLSHKNLRRKETLLLVGLATADFISGIGFFTGGCHRLWMFITGVAWNSVSGWSCMLNFQTVFFIVGAASQGLMMASISLDRMIALTFPLYYHSLDIGYTMKLLGGVALHGITLAIVCFLASYLYMSDVMKPAICLGTWAIPTVLADYYNGMSAAGSCISVALYAYVMTAMYFKQKGQTGKSSRTDKLQKKFTFTVGLITLTTFIFYTIPYGLVTIMKFFVTDRGTITMLSTYLWSLVNVNSMANIFIYIFRMREVRQAVIHILTCSNIGQVEPFGASISGSTTRRASQISIASKRGSIVSQTDPLPKPD